MGIGTAEQHNTQQHLRAFYQPGGPGPEQARLFGGSDMSYIQIEGAGIELLGDVNASFMNDPRRVGQYTPTAIMTTAPSLPTATVTFSERKGGIPRQLMGFGCKANFYELVGTCKDPGDFLRGWSEYVMIYSQGTVKKVDLGDRTSFEGNDRLEGSLDITWGRNPYPVGVLNFGPAGIGTVTAIKVEDICYGSQIQCDANCGISNDGSRFIYAAVDGAAAAKPIVVYSTDYGANWTQYILTLGANAEIPSAIDVVGSYLVVVTKTAGGANQGGYYYTDINNNTGVPNSANWAKVTTGFINLASRAPNDIYVANTNEVYFAADGGYIYKSTDITQGVVVNNAGATVTTNLLRIRGLDNTIIATGSTSAVIVTYNSGKVWGVPTTSPTTGPVGVQAVALQNPSFWWVGTDDGRLFYTVNRGETWVQKRFSGDGAGQVRDIVWATPEVGYFSHSTTAPAARIFSTYDGGFSWTNIAPRINAFGTMANAYRLNVPVYATDPIAANNLAVAGVAANGTDGMVYMGSAGLI
ncbi:MAG: hypothetical protein J0I20_33990 [Chloroflexi bacterium]|nr:hypothetical protein [Chloroflexota bacterium]OJW05593.1 MAG: hypothetical protein BGO39_02970 [Chloroflexi bacterium 54-19]